MNVNNLKNVSVDIPVGVSSRSNPATYTGVMDDVRKAFATANKLNAGLFSFNELA